jgi:8-oxo-dGTP diphosphatase
MHGRPQHCFVADPIEAPSRSPEVTGVPPHVIEAPMPLAPALDAGFRLAYRLAFQALRAWWFLRRPAHRGAIVAVWHAGRVLVVRPSYRRTLDLPGGGLGRGEAAVAAACRELGEEVGIAVAPAALRLTLEMTAWWDFRRDHVSVFELRLDRAPALRIDRREITGAEFMAPAAVLAGQISPFVRAYLAAAAVS